MGSIHIKFRIVEYVVNCSLNNYYFTASNTTYLNLLILPEPTNENDMSSPFFLIEKLNSRRSEIQSFITRLDSNAFTTMAELPDAIPSFYTIPTYDDVGIDWFSFKVNILSFFQIFSNFSIFFIVLIHSMWNFICDCSSYNGY